MDVQITKDKKVILYHDMFIKKQNEIFYINELTYFQLEKVMRELNESPPPLFNEILPIIKQNKKVIFNIEIKSNKLNNYFIIKTIKNYLQKNDIVNQCIISSFNYLLLLQMKFCFRDVLIGFIVGQERLKKNRFALNKIMIKVLRTYIYQPKWRIYI